MKTHIVDQNTPEWDGLRNGKPTGSLFKHVITSAGKQSDTIREYAKSLAQDTYAGHALTAWKGNKYTDMGHEVEPEAVACYEFRYGDTEQVGFITDDAETHGCSPDRITANKVIEIKCFPVLHTTVLIDYHKHKKCPTYLYAQAQGEMYLGEREVCDLFFYHADLPKLLIHVPRDQFFIRKLQEQIQEVLRFKDEYLTILKSMKG